MAPLTEDEEKYVRLALLLRGVAPRAVRTFFDREFPPTYLPSKLNTNYNTLLQLNSDKIINQAQWNLLFPRNGVPNSKTFDVTLMICLIRSLTNVFPRRYGFDSLPSSWITTPCSNLTRIKYYRNELAHPGSRKIDMAYFNTAWTDISNAVRRLGSQTLYQECQELKVKILDQSNQEIMLEIKHCHEKMRELGLTVDDLATNMTKNVEELKSSQSTLQTEQAELREIVKDPIPQNIRDQIKKQLEDWKTKDKLFVSTRASDYVMECLQDNSCVTLTAPSGAGKSFICRHTALVLQKEGYQIIPVYSPIEIRDYYQPGMQSVFIVDDICGNFTVNQSQIDNWKQLLPVIDTIIADTCCKIIVCCRLQVYKDDKFNILSPFKSCECNLISDKFCLTSIEKQNIAKTYIGTNMQDGVSLNSDFFPLLCSLYNKKTNVDLKEFFKSPFDVYRGELEKLSEHGDEGNFKKCGLALCVLFNNQLEEKWFQGKVTDAQRHIIEDTCNACDINRSTSKAKLKKALDTLDDTFICIQNGIYKTLHDKLFDFLAHYFGQKMIECLIDHGDSDLVHQRFIWQKSQNDKTSNIDFIIEIPDDYLDSYLKRLIKDWLAGKVAFVLSNNNMKESSFRQKFLQYLQQLDQLQQVKLANTKDTVLPKESCASGSTPLILTCFDGYTGMVQWMLHNDVDVDQCRDDGVSGLIVAGQQGHTDIVKLLLERNPDVNLCNKDGLSPLLQASQQGHTDIVKLLLERNPDVNLWDKDGRSPLLQASQNGHTDIVKLLLERNPDVDICNKYGSSPLFLASENGHTDIVKLLLKRNPDVNLCCKKESTPLIQASQKGHTDIVRLLLEWNPALCDSTPLSTSYSNNNTRISNNPRLVQPVMKYKPDINAQTYDGGNALYCSARDGNIEITQLLLQNNVDSNICIYSKQYIAEMMKNHPTGTLEKLEQNMFDTLVKSTSSRVTEYVSKKSVDYAFDVVAGSSPLHIACFMGRINVVRCLIDYNANINMAKEDGTTPLFYACEIGYEDIVRLLLDNGADKQICRMDEKSPLEIATENGHTSIKMILTNNMKKRKPCTL